MRIRKRSVQLPFSLLSPPTTLQPLSADPPLKPVDHEQQVVLPKKLHPSVDVDDDLSLENKTHLHNQPSDPSNQSLSTVPKLEYHQPSRSSDLQLTIIRGKNGWICSDDGERNDKEKYWCMNNSISSQVEKKKTTLQGLEEEDGNKEEMKIRRGQDERRSPSRNNLTRMRSSRDGSDGADQVVSGTGIRSISLNNVGMRRWGEGEKAFPLKKRSRGMMTSPISCLLFDERKQQQQQLVGEGIHDDDDQTIIMDHEQKDNNKVMKTTVGSSKLIKTKTTTNKKYWRVHDHEKDQEEEEEDRISTSSGCDTVRRMKRENGGGGSRCSRINGRGWRCCQQTLVGYSLCEHHLGKGRLRSMSSVRKRSTAAAAVNSDDDEKKDQEKPLLQTMRIKKKKIGMVKARSIRSLLGQTQQLLHGSTITR